MADETPSKEKKKSRKSSKSGRRKSSSKRASSSEEFDVDAKSPSEWDPKKFDEQTGEVWKDSDGPKRVQDLPSPAVEEAPPDKKRGDGEEEWPFKEGCAIDEKKKEKKSKKKDKGPSMPSRTRSGTDDDEAAAKSEKRASKKEKKSRRSSKSKRSSSKKQEEEDDSAEEYSSQDKDAALNDGEDDVHDSEQQYDREVDLNDEGFDSHSYHSSYNDSSEEGSFYSNDEDQELYEDFGDDSDNSQGTYGSYDDEEYGEQPRYFQTPGMMDYDEEIHELMNRANPERTEHLNRRVHRRKENVTYDQNMPMMTRQALMTRQASAQAQRRNVDANSVDRRQLGFRNESFHGKDQNRRKPARRGRAPPRSKSSGLGTMAMAARRGPGGGDDGDDRRGAFRSKGATNSFQRHPGKPDNLNRHRGRRPGEMDRSQRGTTSTREPKRGNVKRAKSTTALGRPISNETGPATKPERRGRRPPSKDDVEVNSDVESDSDEEEASSDEDTLRQPKPKKEKPVDKQDMTVKRHRRKLHGILFQVKMGVEMSDLVKEVQKGEIPKSPIRSLLMDEP